MMWLRRFLSFIAVCILSVCLGGMPNTSIAAVSNLNGNNTNITNPVGEVGDFGSWFTGVNMDNLKSNIKSDVIYFLSAVAGTVPDENFIPIEAKISMVYMNALSMVGRVIDISLLRFAVIFILIGYAFWIMFETYQMINGDNDVKKLAESIIKKGMIIAIWIIVLEMGAGRVFMWVMAPILYVGTYLSDLILNSMTGLLNISLPDTCAAVQQYVAANIAPGAIINADETAAIMCVPTRTAGFFYAGVATGAQFIIHGINSSPFTVLLGVGLIILFVYCGFKLAISTLGVITDLFFVVLMLPFTAINETLGKTTYKGIAGQIFNGFLGIFKTQSLSAQVNRFINAAIYFVSLSVVIGISTTILAGFITITNVDGQMTIETADIFTTLLSGALVGYLITNTQEFAKQIGGQINPDTSLNNMMGDGWKLAKKPFEFAGKVRKTIKSGGTTTTP